MFSNGDVLTGTIVGGTNKSVVFSNKITGQFTTKWKDIRSVAVGHAMVLGVNKSCTTCEQKIDLNGSTILVTDQGLAITGRAGGASPTTIALSDLASMADQKPPNACAGGLAVACPGVQLGTLGVNVGLLSSTQKDQNYGENLVLLGNWHSDNTGWPHERTEVELVSSYDDKRQNNEPGSANITQAYDALAKQQFFTTSDSIYTFVVADLYHNNSLGLYFDQAYGGGVGTLQKGLQLDADLRFIGEHFYGPTPSLGLVGSSFSERHEFKLSFIREHATLSETAIVTPVFNASKAWQLQGILDLVIPITDKVGLTTTVTDNYVENTPSSFRKNYLKTTIGFKYSPAKKP